MRKLLSITIVFIVLQMAFTCEDQKNNAMLNAQIIYTGPVAADGCGWLLEIKGKEYSPVELDDLYKSDGLQVEVQVNYLESEFQCGMNPDHKIPQIEIVSIRSLKE